jgi:bacillolysin
VQGRNRFSSFFMALSLLAAGSVAAQAPAFLPTWIDALSAAAAAPVDASVSPRTGLVTFLSTSPGAPIPLSEAARGGSAEARARDFLARWGDLFGFAGQPELLTERVSPVDRVGMEHVRFRQLHRGVPVTGGELTVHLRGDAVVAAHARTLADAALAGISTTPTLQPAASAARVLAALERVGIATEELELSTPRLEILDRGHLGGPPLPPRLVWFVEARRIDLREYVWIDAQSGTVALRFSQLTDAKDREIYDADDPGDAVYDELPGDLVRQEGDAATGDPDADDAYAFSGDTYDFFFDELGRDSFDGAGGTIISTVHFCPSVADCPYANAFWNGEQMVYGDGFPAADDVDAHELAHAVTEYTANLFYYMQSGALNESYSDVFGETVDLTNGAGTDTAGARWLLGEDVPVFGAIRDMEDPTVFGDPGKLSDAQFVCQTPGGDGGGVHSNSGVPNRAYSLMADGGSYNGQTVIGIGLTKAAKIQYRALSEYLLSSSGFADNDAALRQSCADLVGTDGITAGDCAEVGKALDAVEMSDPWPCGAPAAAPVCDAGSPADLFYDDFEELAGATVNNPALLSDWTHQVIAGGGHWSFCCIGVFATGGTGNLWGYNVSGTRDSALAMSSDVTLPADAFLHFRHSHGFEDAGAATFWDGGVIEYSTNGGSTWNDAGGLIDAGDAYGGTISTGDTNPLGGRSAFVADSFGYTATRLALGNLGGEDFRFRFRIGTDSIVDDYGWFVDDFRIYTCGEACGVADLVLSTGTVVGVEEETACESITAGGAYGVGATGDLTLTAPTVVLTDGFSVASGGKLTVITETP